jgi:hypothetical protein
MLRAKGRLIAFAVPLLSLLLVAACSEGSSKGDSSATGGSDVAGSGGAQIQGGSSGPTRTGGAGSGGTAAQGGKASGGIDGAGGSSVNPVGYYTDLASAPVGAFVTAYGTGFGNSGSATLGDSTQTIVSYSDSKVVFSVSGAGGELVIGSRSFGDFPVHVGRVREATPANFGSVWGSVQAGDAIYLRAGTYDQIYGEGDWFQDCTLETYRKGSAEQPIAVVGYPGDAVTFHAAGRHPPLCLADGNSRARRAAFLTFANFDITAETACIDSGGDTTDPSGGPDETGGSNLRIVAIRCQITDVSENTETGMITVQGDGTKILGNHFINDPTREIINNNHGIYIQNGADDVEVAYNIMDGLRMGHVIQIHQDGTPKLYERVSVHDNHLSGLEYGDMRGISVVNVANESTIDISRNVFRHQGQDGWGCINLYRGVIRVEDNDCRDSQGGINLNGGYDGTRRVTLSGNVVCPVAGFPAIGIEGGASDSEYTLSNEKPCN